MVALRLGKVLVSIDLQCEADVYQAKDVVPVCQTWKLNSLKVFPTIKLVVFSWNHCFLNILMSEVSVS